MRLIKRLVIVVLFIIVALHSKIKAQKQYYSKAIYHHKSCKAKYDSKNNVLILYSGKNIDTILLQKNDKAQVIYWENDKWNYNWYDLIINGKSILLKNGLKGFKNHKDKYNLKIQHASHYSGHYSHYSHYSGK